MRPGEPFTLVANERRAAAQPRAADARAYLCDACCARLGDQLRTDEQRTPPPPLPTHVRGVLLEPW